MNSPPPPLEAARLEAYTHVRTGILDLVPPGANHILDLGCSDGTSGAMLKRLEPGRRVVGVEYSPELSAAASDRLDLVIRGSLDEPATLEALQGQRFDCVICADVLEHLREPWQTLAAVAPLMATGGTLVMSVPNIRHLSALKAIFWTGRFPREPRGIFDSTHLRWFTFRDTRDLLDAHELRITRLNCSLRFGDKGGGRANRLLNRWFSGLAPRLPLLREFLTYQFEIQAVRK